MRQDNQLNFSSETEEKVYERSCFIIDLDGVVYSGSKAIAGAVEAIAQFRSIGKRVTFLTNNSAKSLASVVKKLVDLGISCTQEDVMSAGQAAAFFIKTQQLDLGQGVFVVGTDDLREELTNCGISCADPYSCGAILVGLDPKFNYSVITEALVALQRGVLFIICNRDANFPGEGGKSMPGCGAMVGALEAVSQKEADFQIGKPNTIMLDILMNRLNLIPDDCLIIGDGLDSDILMANNARIPSVLISKKKDSLLLDYSLAKPSLCVESLSDLYEYIFNRV